MEIEAQPIERKYYRDTRLFLKTTFILAGLVVLGIFLIYPIIDSSQQDMYHQFRSAKSGLLGGFCLLLGGWGLFQQFLFLLNGGPMLILSKEGFSFKGAWRTRQLAWIEVGVFRFSNKNLLKASLVDRPGKFFSFTVTMFVDRVSICNDLNRNIAFARDIDFQSIKLQTEQEFANLSEVNQQILENRKILLQRSKLRLKTLVISIIFAFIILKILFAYVPTLMQPFTYYIPLILVVLPSIAVFASVYVGNKKWPLSKTGQS